MNLDNEPGRGPYSSGSCANACVPHLIEVFHPKSVLDIGCNQGCWLHKFEEYGLTDFTGLDGENMPRIFEVDLSHFVEHDLTKPISLNRKYDLVLCLEVAEHIDGKYADVLMDTICNHSDNVCFSAATPGQGGGGHVNEQPHKYWIDKFTQRGYKADENFRKTFHGMAYWYQNNMILFSKE